nr:hypothetical protein [Pandoravirus massiliensis]
MCVGRVRALETSRRRLFFARRLLFRPGHQKREKTAAKRMPTKQRPVRDRQTDISFFFVSCRRAAYQDPLFICLAMTTHTPRRKEQRGGKKKRPTMIWLCGTAGRGKQSRWRLVNLFDAHCRHGRGRVALRRRRLLVARVLLTGRYNGLEGHHAYKWHGATRASGKYAVFAAQE